MKHYYGNNPAEVYWNKPTEIKTAKQLEQLKQAYAIVIPVSQEFKNDEELEDDEENEKGGN